MKVLHISSAKTIRGGEYQIKLLIKELSAVGVKNYLLCPSGSALSKSNIDGLIQMFTYIKFSPANLMVSAFIKKLSAEQEIDIIHLHDPHSHQYAFYSYKLFSNLVPAVVTRRVSFPIKSTSRAYYSHEKIKNIICVSHSVKKLIANLNLSEKKITIIPSGIPLDLQTSVQSLREIYDIRNEIKVVANLAAISPQKDYKTFVKVANHLLKETNQDVIFLIIGKDDGELGEVKKLVKEFDLEQKIIFAGHLPSAHQYFKDDIDVLLSTSVSEGLGNTVMEAMKYRVPIVATKCEGTIDLVKHNKSAMLAEIGDYNQLSLHLNKLLSDEALALTLTENAHHAMKEYDIVKTSAQVFDLYKSILESSHNI